MTYHDRLASTTVRERWQASAYAIILLAVNAYICARLFTVSGAHMNSMYGFWAAIAQRAGGSWLHPTWWPYWDGGMPFEFTYAPLVPALTAIWAAARGLSELLAMQSITGVVYCLVPMTLFISAWRLTRAAGYSFAAALLYSFSSPTQMLMPDEGFRWNGWFDARRLFIAVNWDETPHLLALAMLPLTVLFLVRSIETGRRRYFAAAALSIAIATLASAFGPITTLMAAVCLIAALRHRGYARSIAITGMIGLLAYALSAAFLPPSLISAMRAASKNPMHDEPGWTAASLTALGIVVLGWVALWQIFPRWTSDWRLRFFALFAYLSTSIPLVFLYFHRQFLPQPVRYKFEAELGLALVIVFGLRAWLDRWPASLRRAAIFVLAALALEQVQAYRADMRAWVTPADTAASIESRAALWADRNLPGARVWFPGSLAQWADTFAEVQQFSGGSWSMAYNQTELRGTEAVKWGDARTSLAWLKAFGASAVAIPGANTEEYWKGFPRQERFEGMLPVLWREGGVTIYKVPLPDASLAHVAPRDALLAASPRGFDDIAGLERYASSLMPAEMRWEGRNRIYIRAAAAQGRVVSIQVNYHRGWHALIGGRAAPLHRDGLGFMWLQPDAAGPADIVLDYDGGWELRLCRWISAIAFAGLLLMFALPSRRTQDIL